MMSEIIPIKESKFILFNFWPNHRIQEFKISDLSPNPLLMYSANVKDSENVDRR